MFPFGKKKKDKTVSEGASSETISTSTSITTRTLTHSIITSTTQHVSVTSNFNTSGFGGSLRSTRDQRIIENGTSPSSRLTLPSLGLKHISSTPTLSSSSQLKTDAKPFKLPSYGACTSQLPSTSSPLSSRPINTSYVSPYFTARPNTICNVPATSPDYVLNKHKKLVWKTGKKYDKIPGSKVPVYETSGKNRGKALIINNIEFEGIEKRLGAEVDDRDLKDVLEQCGLTVIHHQNLKKSGMLNEIKAFKKHRELKEVDLAMVCVMSHGHNNKKEGGYTQVYGTDGKGLSVDEILNEFTSKACPYLAGKPKIFILQCCRGEAIETDSNKKKPREHADMLVAYSTLPGFSSMRSTTQGSWYIQEICNVFRDHAHEHDVETMFKIVDQKLAEKHPTEKQTSMYECRGFKKCYLHP